jgi:hypothetical protein
MLVAGHAVVSAAVAVCAQAIEKAYSIPWLLPFSDDVDTSTDVSTSGEEHYHLHDTAPPNLPEGRGKRTTPVSKEERRIAHDSARLTGGARKLTVYRYE